MKFWQINNSAKEETELIFYGPIMDSKPWWKDGQCITSEAFINDLDTLKNKKSLTIRINSGGGDVFTATAIYTQLKALKSFKTIIIDGVCASAATIIAMAGNKIKIPSNAFIMIHNPSITIWDSFTSDDLEQLKNSLDICKSGIIESYKTRTKLSYEELSEMMDNETWMTGRQAVDNGFADEIMFEDIKVSDIDNAGRFTVVNNIPIDFSQYKNQPNFYPDEKNKEEGEKNMTLEELKNSYPKIYNEIYDLGKKEGESLERQRLKDIDEISNIITPEILNKAKYENPIDVKTLAFESAKLEAQKGANFFNALNDDSKESQVGNVDVSVESPTNNEDETKSAEKINSFANLLNKDKRRKCNGAV